MKKLLALVIALAMVLSLATVLVSAEDEPEGYLWLRAEDASTAPGINFKVPGSVLVDDDITIKALVKFGDDCVANGGCVYLNCYSYEQDEYNNWDYLICFIDYAKDSTVTLGEWTEVTYSFNPFNGSYGSHTGKCTPAMLSMGIGFYLATGTISVAHIIVEQGGEEVWGIDFSEGFDVDDSDDLALVCENGMFNMTGDNKDEAWGCVAATVDVSEPAEESTPAEPANLENIAAGKTYTVTGATPRGDGWDDDGTKLTDGNYEVDGGTYFFGMKGTLPDPVDADVDVNVDIVLDLGEVRNFSKITADASYGAWGISAPGGVRFAVSEDGENFTEVGNATSGESLDGFSGDWVGTLYSAEGNFTGRYVKVTYYKHNDGQSNHIWISEIEVLAEGEPAPIEESTPAEESKPVTPTTGDAGIIALAVVSVIALGGAVIVKKSK